MNLVDLKHVELRSDAPPQMLSHPGMIAPQERNLLYTLAADHYCGTGCIVDAGAFLGASTMALAYGLRQHPPGSLPARTAKPIHTFERAIVSPNFARHAEHAGLPILPLGESFDEILRQLTEPAQDEVQLHIGDILEFKASSLGPIEICFLDILKNPQISLHCTRSFFPLLQAGAHVIQQDYFFQGLPFVKYSMEALSDHFEYLGEVRSSALFRLKQPIDVADLPTDFEDFNAETKLRLHRQAEQRTTDPVRQYLMQLSRARLLIELKDFEAADAVWRHADEKYATLIKDDSGRYKDNIAWRAGSLKDFMVQKRSRSSFRSKRTGNFKATALTEQVVQLCREGKNKAAREHLLSKGGELLYAEMHPAEKLNHLTYLSRMIQSGEGSKHGYHKLLRKRQRLRTFLEPHDSTRGGFVDFGCGGHDPIALSVLHYANGFYPCHAVDLRSPRNELYSALSMYEIVANILSFPKRYCFKGTKVTELLKRMRQLNLEAFESGDFWRGFERLKGDMRLETHGLANSGIEEQSITRVVSVSVLEHVMDLGAVCRELHRITRPGGIVFHHVDLVDPRSYLQGEKFSCFSFLADEDSSSDANRLRAGEIVGSHESVGFEVVKDDREFGTIPDEVRERLLPRFREMPEEDLTATKLNLVLRRI